MTPPGSFTLIPVAVVEMADQHRHFLKVRSQSQWADRTVWIPLGTLLGNTDQPLRKFLADHVGYVAPDDDPQLAALVDPTWKVPRVFGTSRLGWTPDRDAFIYTRKVYYADPKQARRYEFIAPEGTLLKHASTAFDPAGSREAQYEGLKEAWKRFPLSRLVLALAAVSPMLEILGTPTLAFHLYGRTGFGKTTLLRLGTAVYAQPGSPVTSIDLSKDTQNYADAHLGILHNFPILLDETTLGDREQWARLAYNIAMGRTKGRLTGPEQHYLPAEPINYTLVCFMSGEGSIWEHLDYRGGTARLQEIGVDDPLIPEDELPKWWAFAETHYGWFGRDLMLRLFQRHFRNGKGAQELQWLYTVCHCYTGLWCHDHSRTRDFLAAIQIGYRHAGATLWGADPGHVEAGAFAKEVYAQLTKATKLDDVLVAVADKITPKWADRGYFPLDLEGRTELDDVARELGWKDHHELLGFLRRQSIVKKIEPRRVKYAGSGPATAVRSAILTDEGKKRLAGCSPTTEGLHSDEDNKTQ